MIEQVLEDVLVGGFGAIELDLTGDAERPLVLWPVDGASIRIRTDWDGNPASPHYVQATGAFTPNTEITLADEELSYIRLNPRTHTPFGLGKLEVAFETIHEFLCAHRFASRLASNSVVQYALWLQNLSPAHHERLIRWWQDEIEGTGKVPILSVETKPEVLRFSGGTDADLRLQWQEFLIRIIADAFDLPPMLLGLERDVNRNTATTQYDDAFRTAVVPVARLVAEHLTRDVIGKRAGLGRPGVRLHRCGCAERTGAGADPANPDWLRSADRQRGAAHARTASAAGKARRGGGRAGDAVALVAVRCSLFAVRCSLFAVRCSLFAVRCSLFAFRFSLFAFRQKRATFLLRIEALRLRSGDDRGEYEELANCWSRSNLSHTSLCIRARLEPCHPGQQRPWALAPDGPSLTVAGAKAPDLSAPGSARLKSCPDTNRRDYEMSCGYPVATCRYLTT